MNRNRIRQCWAQGKPAFAVWLQLPGSLHAEALARQGYDALVIDLQHSPIEPATAYQMMPAIELGGAEPVVRLKENVASDAMKLVDLGSAGIIAPMVNTAQEARRLVDGLRYPPLGSRSYGPRRPGMRFGSGYLAEASDTIVILAMIETGEAIANLPEILAVEGLDGTFIGPTDLALSLGQKPEVDTANPVVASAIEDIRRRTKEAGKRAGIFCGSGEYAALKAAEGFDFISVAPDLALLQAASAKALTAARAGLQVDRKQANNSRTERR